MQTDEEKSEMLGKNFSREAGHGGTGEGREPPPTGTPNRRAGLHTVLRRGLQCAQHPASHDKADFRRLLVRAPWREASSKASGFAGGAPHVQDEASDDGSLCSPTVSELVACFISSNLEARLTVWKQRGRGSSVSADESLLQRLSPRAFCFSLLSPARAREGVQNCFSGKTSSKLTRDVLLDSGNQQRRESGLDACLLPLGSLSVPSGVDCLRFKSPEARAAPTDSVCNCLGSCWVVWDRVGSSAFMLKCY
ncbi:hypothetical protein Esti_005672 [Eimeria stiedai]